MKKKDLLKFVFIFLFSSLLNLPSHSQTHKYFVLTGKILTDSDGLKNASIQVIKNKKQTISTPIPDHGRFRLELEYNADYQLVFNSEGYLSKTIAVNTGIPPEIIQRTDNFPHFLMAVKLSKENQELYGQMQKICYSPEKDCFARVPGIYDIEYVAKDYAASKSGSYSQMNKSKMQIYQVF